MFQVNHDLAHHVEFLFISDFPIFPYVCVVSIMYHSEQSPVLFLTKMQDIRKFALLFEPISITPTYTR